MYLHGEGIVHGDVCSSNVLLKAAQTQRGFTSKVGRESQGQPTTCRSCLFHGVRAPAELSGQLPRRMASCQAL